MAAICIKVEQVVEYIDAGGAQAEGRKGQQRIGHCRCFQEAVGGQQRNEHQQVLQPLVRTQCLQPRLRPGRCRPVPQYLRALRCGARQCAAVVDHPGACGAGPDRQVDRAIAGVVETALAKRIYQGLRLVRAGQVALAVAGNDLFKQAQMCGDRRNQQLVRGGAQHPRALRRVAQQLQYLWVVRQVAWIDGGACSDLPLQCGLALQQPERQQEQVQRIPRQQHQQRFIQKVRVQQRAIQVHAQGAWTGDAFIRGALTRHRAIRRFSHPA